MRFAVAPGALVLGILLLGMLLSALAPRVLSGNPGSAPEAAGRHKGPSVERTEEEPRFRCDGRWEGTVHNDRGRPAEFSAHLRSTRPACGTFVETWRETFVCHYTLSRCRMNRGRTRLTADARSAPGEVRNGGCEPVAVSFTCRDGRAVRFRERYNGDRHIVGDLRRARRGSSR